MQRQGWARGVAGLVAGALALGGAACGGGGEAGARVGASAGGAGAQVAPEGLTATAVGPAAIDLAWTDRSATEVGFKIERRQGRSAYIEVAVLGPNAESYRDSGLVPGQRYIYQVTAFDGRGPLGTSNEAAAQTIGEWTRQIGSAGVDEARAVAADASAGGAADPLIYTVGRTNGALAPLAGGFDAYLRRFGADGQVRFTVAFGTADDDDALDVAIEPVTGDAIVVGRTLGDLGGAGNQGGYDAFVARFDPTGALVWVAQRGTAMHDHASAVAVGPRGEILVAGYVSDPAHGNGQDPFVFRYDASGALQWAWTNVLWGNESVTGLAVDAAGSAYICGRSQFTMPGALAQQGGGDIYVAKVDPQGQTVWMTQVGTPPAGGHTGHDMAGGIAVGGPHGRIYVSGFVQGEAAGPGSYLGPAVTSATKWDHWGDAVVFALDASGAVVGVAQWGTAEDDHVRDLAVTASGEVYATGHTRGDAAGGGAAAGKADVFVTRLDGALQVAWTRQWGSAEDDFAGALALGASGAILVAGSTAADLDGPGPDAHAGDRDPFILHALD